MQSEREIRSVAVVGGGIVGLSAAIAFARALPKARVEVVATAPDPAALADLMPGTLPTVNRFHAAIGLDELELVRAGIATHRLGTRFERWSADGTPWLHVFGEYGFAIGAVGFHDLWPQVRSETLPYHAYSPAAVLAEAGRFVHPEERTGSPLSTYIYGLALDPDSYRERLLAQTATHAIAAAPGEPAGVERRADGGVAALLLGDGRRVEADLYLDCAGPGGALISQVDERFEDWSDWLPCDRMSVRPEPGERPVPADTVIALEDGWRWSSSAGGGRMTGRLTASAFAPGGGDGVKLRPGRRPEPWVRNVLALGDAATAVDPLEWTNLHLAHNAILRALELLPGRDCHPLELAEYNRRTAQETLRVRDFLALHYLRSGRREGALWQALAGRAPPDSLAHTLEQFEARGRLPFYEEESFEKESWNAVLLGMGVVPRVLAASALGLDLDEVARAMRDYAARLADLAARLPAYRDYLERMRSVPAGSSLRGG
ncbi:MAG: tryptophan 7-halogenase [Sphingomonadales bacterium]|jgi:tryptophan halogenase|nr:tryptophan 7-halogenase [Sphingomonadales bacterium]